MRFTDVHRFCGVAFLCCALLPLVVSGLASAALPNTAPRVEFAQLAAASEVDNFSLSEDGRHLALANETAGTVEIWDVAKKASITTLRTPDPRFMLWRRGTLFVANYEEGTISLFAGETFKPGPVVFAGSKHVCFLSAPEALAFGGMLLATCETIGGNTIYSVAVAGGAPRACGNLNHGIAIFTPDGSRIIEQVFRCPGFEAWAQSERLIGRSRSGSRTTRDTFQKSARKPGS